jgi:hypothetical protein
MIASQRNPSYEEACRRALEILQSAEAGHPSGMHELTIDEQALKIADGLIAELWHHADLSQLDAPKAKRYLELRGFEAKDVKCSLCGGTDRVGLSVLIRNDEPVCRWCRQAWYDIDWKDNRDILAYSLTLQGRE